ncbi:MFS transporter [Streptomyces shenzhenensis]|uniref:MFS transporter n=1 Tax=Streptomyces shenzhenensis TaxID=943815 RepID=UPI0033E9EC8B
MAEPARKQPHPALEPVRAAATATYAAFIGCGFGPATYLSRLAEVREHLQLSTGRLGMILLATAAGALCFRPLAGRVIGRLGQRRTVAVCSVVAGAGQVLLGAGDVAGVAVVVLGLAVVGFAGAGWDVAMNVQGTRVEREFGRSVMPRFHAAYSMGTVGGASTGILMVLAGVPVAAHLLVTGVLTAVVMPLAVRRFLPDAVHEPNSPADRRGGHRPQSFWREPRTVLIGLFVLAFGFGEGAGSDWISVSVVDGYHGQAVVGTAALATFLISTTVTRWFGGGLLDRFGRVAVLRASSAVAATGLVLFVSGLGLPTAFAGVALWGVGIAFGYPVGMSAAADDPRYAAQRVAVASTIGKVSSFAGPPLLGLLGDRLGMLHTLLVVAALQLVACAIAAVTRPPAVAPAAAPALKSA